MRTRSWFGAAAWALIACSLAWGAEGNVDKEVLLLWPDGAPGAKGDQEADQPRMVWFPAPADAAVGACVIVCPGGGYGGLSWEKEGTKFAEFFNGFGVSAYVLQYRVAPYKHPVPMEDGQRAIRIARAQAAQRGYRADRIGVMGFSAGGHLVTTLATHFDAGNAQSTDPIDLVGCRPDFLIAAYPVITMTDPYTHAGSRWNLLGKTPDPAMIELLSNEKQVTAETPPTFLFHTANDDAVPSENSTYFYNALRKAGVPAEMHIFADGPHGVGLAEDDPELKVWPSLLQAWMGGMGFLTK